MSFKVGKLRIRHHGGGGSVKFFVRRCAWLLLNLFLTIQIYQVCKNKIAQIGCFYGNLLKKTKAINWALFVMITSDRYTKHLGEKFKYKCRPNYRKKYIKRDSKSQNFEIRQTHLDTKIFDPSSTCGYS